LLAFDSDDVFARSAPRLTTAFCQARDGALILPDAAARCSSARHRSTRVLRHYCFTGAMLLPATRCTAFPPIFFADEERRRCPCRMPLMRQ